MEDKNPFVDSLHQRLSEEFLSDLRGEFRRDLEWLTRPRDEFFENLETTTNDPEQQSVFQTVRKHVSKVFGHKKPSKVENPAVVIEAAFVVIEPSSRQNEDMENSNQSGVNYEQPDNIWEYRSWPPTKPASRDRKNSQARYGNSSGSTRIRRLRD